MFSIRTNDLSVIEILAFCDCFDAEPFKDNSHYKLYPFLCFNPTTGDINLQPAATCSVDLTDLFKLKRAPSRGPAKFYNGKDFVNVCVIDSQPTYVVYSCEEVFSVVPFKDALFFETDVLKTFKNKMGQLFPEIDYWRVLSELINLGYISKEIFVNYKKEIK